VSIRSLFTAIAALAMTAGTGLWLLQRPAGPGFAGPKAGPIEIAPAAMLAASFADAAGRPQSLGQFQGKLVVVNFWATWCAPCREEMPAFNRLQQRWSGRGVQFVGIANEAPAKVHDFGTRLGIAYPLWTGGEEVGELSRRLGNRPGVLPHTVLLGPTGEVLETRVGPYSEAELDLRLSSFAPKTR
jgi:thiol-disulfide isomerase/thioredoxin